MKAARSAFARKRCDTGPGRATELPALSADEACADVMNSAFGLCRWWSELERQARRRLDRLAVFHLRQKTPHAHRCKRRLAKCRVRCFRDVRLEHGATRVDAKRNDRLTF